MVAGGVLSCLMLRWLLVSADDVMLRWQFFADCGVMYLYC